MTDQTQDQPSKYVWAGSVIRLTREHYDQWEKAFFNIDLKAALLARDIELSEPGKEVESVRWFYTTAMWLMAMHQNQTRIIAGEQRTWKQRNDPNRNDPFASQYAKED